MNQINNNKEEVRISPKEMLEHAKAAGYTAREFSIWAKSKGYSAKMVLNLTQQYMESYQNEKPKDS